MRKVIAVASVIACSQMLVGAERLAPVRRTDAESRDRSRQRASNLIDYWTDGADIERSGWIKDEKILTKAQRRHAEAEMEARDRQSAARAARADAGAGDRPAEHRGRREAGRDRQRHLRQPLRASTSRPARFSGRSTGTTRRRRAAAARGAAPTDPKRLGFLQPGGSSDTPVIGPADAQGRRPVYFVTGDGMLHIINAADGTDLQPPYKFYGGKGWALNLVGNTLWMQTTYGGASIAAVRVDDPEHKVMTWSAGSGGAWGRRGVAVDSNGTAWTTTGDGVYDLTSDPPRYANSVVGVHIVNNEMKLKDYYTPTNWEWLRKRDLDPNNTPTVFKYKGRELVAASGKECRSVSARSGVGRRREPPDAGLQDLALLQRGSGLSGHGQLGRARARGRTRAAPAGCWRRSGARCTRRPSSRCPTVR